MSNSNRYWAFVRVELGIYSVVGAMVFGSVGWRWSIFFLYLVVSQRRGGGGGGKCEPMSGHKAQVVESQGLLGVGGEGEDLRVWWEETMGRK